ncbi:ABC transporter substrate-binding protein [Spartinivicinus poritis]|uniref:ABC transporter substrate-binding protein n=1 Tax=Spartinivicinus poritis TaxID=2994640 RepID=A0ABT5U2U6_9GAMM|nr:ABC transporter substrate-binding protein [Spartinivicinus sp. A2-2]MDE1460690.1 ABC transporter substrate-binding protein [Spartinivicinus sp. A2-2]
MSRKNGSSVFGQCWLAGLTLLMALLMSSSSVANESKQADQQTKKILMLLWRGETQADQAFKAKLENTIGSVQFTQIDVNQDRKQLTKALREQVSQFDQYDLIYVFGTSATRTVRHYTHEKVPLLFNMVSDPIGSDIVESFAEPPKGLTGVSDGVAVAYQVHLLQQLLPFKSLLVPYNPKERNAALYIKQLKPVARRLNIKLKIVRVSDNESRWQGFLTKLAKGEWQTDAVLIPQSSFLVSKTDTIRRLAGKYKMPVFTASASGIQLGALASVSPNLTHLGELAADKAIAILNGTAPETLPVERIERPGIIVNKKEWKKLGKPMATALRKKCRFDNDDICQ